MQAAFHREQGGLDVLQVAALPDAVAGPDDVLIRAQASSLDRVDLYFRTGANGMRLPPGGPHIGGRDVAGVIASIGSAAAAAFPDLTVGTRVVGGGGGSA